MEQLDKVYVEPKPDDVVMQVFRFGDMQKHSHLLQRLYLFQSPLSLSTFPVFKKFTFMQMTPLLNQGVQLF